MKVLQFIPSIGAEDGGTATYMQQLCASLGKLCELHVCALTPVETFVPLEHCQKHSIPNCLKNSSEMKRAWLSLLDEIKPDVVHINCCWLPQIAFVTKWTHHWRKKQSSNNNHQVSLLLTPHGMLEPWILRRNFLTKKLPALLLYQLRAIRQCDRIIATSEQERDHILKYKWHKDVAIVKNGIDVEAIVPKTEYKEPKHLLFMSRIHPKKGLEMLIEALGEMPIGYSFHLKIAGTGDEAYIAKLQEQIESIGLEYNIKFVGPVYGEEKWQMLRDADVVILPSYSENYGLIVAEALASGTPVITTTGTPWMSLRENKCGWWIAPNAKALRDALTDMRLCSAVEMKCLGERARKLAEIDCAISQNVRDLYQLYLTKDTKSSKR